MVASSASPARTVTRLMFTLHVSFIRICERLAHRLLAYFRVGRQALRADAAKSRREAHRGVPKATGIASGQVATSNPAPTAQAGLVRSLLPRTGVLGYFKAVPSRLVRVHPDTDCSYETGESGVGDHRSVYRFMRIGQGQLADRPLEFRRSPETVTRWATQQASAVCIHKIHG